MVVSFVTLFLPAYTVGEEEKRATVVRHYFKEQDWKMGSGSANSGQGLKFPVQLNKIFMFSTFSRVTKYQMKC